MGADHKLGVSRRELFERIDRPALKPLPAEPYQYAEWKKCRVAPDYHIEIDGHYYSVPSRLIRMQVETRQQVKEHNAAWDALCKK